MRAVCRVALAALGVSLFLSSPAVTQRGPGDLAIALSSLATESLDPPVSGHLVKYYLSTIFDYLIGTTPDGQLSRETGIATKWEASADHRRWTFTLRRGVKFHNGDD